MNATRFNDHQFSFTPLPAVIASALPGDADDDWAEFLSLGMPSEASDLDVGAPWARSPVLLSY